MLLMMTSICIGGLLVKSNAVESRTLNLSRKAEVNDSAIKVREQRLYFLFLFVFLSGFIVIASKVAPMIFSSGYLKYVLMTRGSEDGGSSLLFGSGFLLGYMNNIAVPFLYGTLFIGAGIYFQTKSKKLLKASILLIILYSFILSAREGILIVFIVIAVGLLCFKVPDISRKKQNLILLSFVGLMLSFIVYISLSRNSGLDMLGIILHYFVTYHTVGFTLFDISLVNDNSYLNNHVFLGRATFGVVEQFTQLIIKPLDRDIFTALMTEIRNHIQEPIIVGYSELSSTGVYTLNSYYTILYTLYLDFRLLGVTIIPCYYGYLMNKHFILARENNNAYSFSIVLVLFYLGYSSILMPIVIRPFFWPMIILIFLFYKIKIQKSRE
jgi:oligosaccharide repeat unit polymerase